MKIYIIAVLGAISINHSCHLAYGVFEFDSSGFAITLILFAEVAMVS